MLSHSSEALRERGGEGDEVWTPISLVTDCTTDGTEDARRRLSEVGLSEESSRKSGRDEFADGCLAIKRGDCVGGVGISGPPKT